MKFTDVRSGETDWDGASMDELVERPAARSGSSCLSGTMGDGLMVPGPGIDEFQSIARRFFRFDRDKIGAEHMSEIISGTPSLSQFA